MVDHLQLAESAELQVSYGDQAGGGTTTVCSFGPVIDLTEMVELTMVVQTRKPKGSAYANRGIFAWNLDCDGALKLLVIFNLPTLSLLLVMVRFLGRNYSYSN